MKLIINKLSHRKVADLWGWWLVVVIINAKRTAARQMKVDLEAERCTFKYLFWSCNFWPSTMVIDNCQPSPTKCWHSPMQCQQLSTVLLEYSINHQILTATSPWLVVVGVCWMMKNLPLGFHRLILLSLVSVACLPEWACSCTCMYCFLICLCCRWSRLQWFITDAHISSWSKRVVHIFHFHHWRWLDWVDQEILC